LKFTRRDFAVKYPRAVCLKCVNAAAQHTAEACTIANKVREGRDHLKGVPSIGYSAKETCTQSSSLCAQSQVHINAFEDLSKKTSSSAKLPEASRNTKNVLFYKICFCLQNPDTIKKIRSRHKTTATDGSSHDSTASFAYAKSQEIQDCICHLERVYSIWPVTSGEEGSPRSTNPYLILLFLQKCHKQLVQFSIA